MEPFDFESLPRRSTFNFLYWDCIIMVEKPSSALVHNANTVLKPSLKKKSGFDNSSVGGKRHPTGRRLSFSDENGGNLAKVRGLQLMRHDFSSPKITECLLNPNLFCIPLVSIIP